MLVLIFAYTVLCGDTTENPDQKSKIRAACGSEAAFDVVRYIREEHQGTTSIPGVGTFPIHFRLTYSIEVPLTLFESITEDGVVIRSGFNGTSFWKDEKQQKAPLLFEAPILEYRKNALLVILSQPVWEYQAVRKISINNQQYEVAVFRHQVDGDLFNLLLDPGTARVCGILDVEDPESYTLFEAFESFQGITLPIKTKSFHNGKLIASIETTYDLFHELSLQSFEKQPKEN